MPRVSEARLPFLRAHLHPYQRDILARVSESMGFVFPTKREQLRCSWLVTLGLLRSEGPSPKMFFITEAGRAALAGGKE